MELTSTGSPEEKLKRAYKMYDADGNGVIDLEEMTNIIQAFYDMLSSSNKKQVKKLIKRKTPRERAERIFKKMNSDKVGHLTESEFFEGCYKDKELEQILVMEQSFSNVMLSML